LTNTIDHDWQMTDPTSRQRGPHMDRTVTFKQEETSGHEPQPGLDTKIDRLTDRQSQCDFDLHMHNVCTLEETPYAAYGNNG
jgi:hypothetical protein